MSSTFGRSRDRSRTRGHALASGGAPAYSPLSLSPLVWLDAGAVTGVSDGSPASTWPDLSGNSLSATGTGTTRPIWHASDAGFGGNPSLQGDGSDDIMSTPSIAALAGLTKLTLAVSLYDTQTSVAVAVEIGPNINTAIGSALVANDQAAGRLAGFLSPNPAAAAQANYTTEALATAKVVVLRQDRTLGAGLQQDMRINSVAQTLTNYAGPATVSGAFVAQALNVFSRAGSAVPWAGRIRDLLLIPSRLSDTDAAALEHYMGSRAGLSL